MLAALTLFPSFFHLPPTTAHSVNRASIYSKMTSDNGYVFAHVWRSSKARRSTTGISGSRLQFPPRNQVIERKRSLLVSWRNYDGKARLRAKRRQKQGAYLCSCPVITHTRKFVVSRHCPTDLCEPITYSRSLGAPISFRGFLSHKAPSFHLRLLYPPLGVFE